MARTRSLTTLRRQLRVVTFAAVVGLPLLALWVLLVSDEPAAPQQQRPNAQTIQAAQDAVRQIQQVQGATVTSK
jgi:hypothetical protein